MGVRCGAQVMFEALSEFSVDELKSMTDAKIEIACFSVSQVLNIDFTSRSIVLAES